MRENPLRGWRSGGRIGLRFSKVFGLTSRIMIVPFTALGNTEGEHQI